MTSRDDLAKRRRSSRLSESLSLLLGKKVREGLLSRAVKELLLGLQRTCVLDVTNV